VTVVTLNGAEKELPKGATVEAAVRAAGAPEHGRGVAVAVDGEVLPRGEWATTEIQEGQKVEVLHAVQGGQ
jgi:sulfur carrier protein